MNMGLPEVLNHVVESTKLLQKIQSMSVYEKLKGKPREKSYKNSMLW